MFLLKILLCFLLFTCSFLSATEFTISSYNCGGLSDHYDYLRAATMQKIMKERLEVEEDKMALNEEIQKLALKILFAPEKEKLEAQQEWADKDFDKVLINLASPTDEPGSDNKEWNEKLENAITPYKTRPIVISDDEVNKMLKTHISNLSIGEVRAQMTKDIIADELKYDIICLQEADYIDSSMFPSNYTLMVDEFANKSLNGIAFNKERFEMKYNIYFGNRLYGLKLRDLETKKTIVVISGHLSGCNSYSAQLDIKPKPKPKVKANAHGNVKVNEKAEKDLYAYVKAKVDVEVEKSDSLKGDNELIAAIEHFEQFSSNLIIFAMDSNVTSLHPRMKILKNANYVLDYENCLEPTCTNPNLLLNTRIDWIALKNLSLHATITNIPVSMEKVGLNNIETNMSDHRPIAAKISYDE